MIGAAIRRIAAALSAAALLLVLAVPAGAATKTPFKAHGVFASCGKGEDRATLYMTFLSLRNERGFDDVKALLRHADAVRPRGLKLRAPRQDRDRALHSVGASLPDFLFIDSLETKGGPGAAARERATISWRSKKSGGTRLRTSLRMNDLGDEFCEPGEDKSADQERMLREAAPAPEDAAESTATEPEASRGSGRGASERQSPASACPAGIYFGSAPDGTKLHFSLSRPTEIIQGPGGHIDANAYVSQINVHANPTRGPDLRYEVDLPDTYARGFYFPRFSTSLPASQTGLGYSPAAEMSGNCVSPDRFQVTIRDRAGERTATLSRVVPSALALRPGVYEGRVEGAFQSWGSIRFRIAAHRLVQNPIFDFDDSQREIWPWHFMNSEDAELESGYCGLRFRASSRLLNSHHSLVWSGEGTCKPGDRLTGQLEPLGFDQSSFGRGLAGSYRLSWSARRTGD